MFNHSYAQLIWFCPFILFITPHSRIAWCCTKQHLRLVCNNLLFLDKIVSPVTNTCLQVLPHQHTLLLLIQVQADPLHHRITDMTLSSAQQQAYTYRVQDEFISAYRYSRTYPFTPIVNPSARWNGILKKERLGTSLILICCRSSSILVMEMDCGRSEVLFSSSVKVSAGKTNCLPS